VAVDVVAVGRRVRALRDGRGLSQGALAAAAGVSRQAVSALESGRHLPRVDAALALASALGTTVERLLAGDHPPAVAVCGPAPAEGQAVRAARVGERVVCAPLPAPGDGESWAAPDGVVRAGRVVPLEGAALDGFVLLGCDPALGVLAALGPASSGRLMVVPATSRVARQALAGGRAHAALVHGSQPDADEPKGVVRVPFARWRTGLAAAPGAARALDAALAGRAPVVQRDVGAAAQGAYLRALARAGVGEAPDGVIASGHLDAARRAAETGLAAVTIEPVARALGLEFRALETHRAEIWLARDALGHPGGQALGVLVSSAAFRRRIAALSGYEAA
jgi:DNA-binding XRE family transcriptional regulator